MTVDDDVRLLREVVATALRRETTDPDARREAVADWQMVRQNGWDQAGLTPDASVEETTVVAEELAAWAVSVPLVAHHLARWVLAQSAAVPPTPGVTLMAPPSDAVVLTSGTAGPRLHGTLPRVPWVGLADLLVVYARDENRDALVVVPPRAPGVHVEAGTNLAGEPRDRVVFEDCRLAPGAVVRGAPDRTTVQLRAGLLGAAEMLGAMRRAHELAVDHARTRQQFGRPIASFDAVAGHLAEMAAEIQLVRAAVERATVAHDVGIDRLVHTASAKVVAAHAAGVVAERAHQVFGALGTTQEHPLHLFTMRLLSWRDEWGAEHEWARALGEYASGLGTDEYWAVLTL